MSGPWPFKEYSASPVAVHERAVAAVVRGHIAIPDTSGAGADAAETGQLIHDSDHRLVPLNIQVSGTAEQGARQEKVACPAALYSALTKPKGRPTREDVRGYVSNGHIFGVYRRAPGEYVWLIFIKKSEHKNQNHKS